MTGRGVERIRSLALAISLAALLVSVLPIVVSFHDEMILYSIIAKAEPAPKPDLQQKIEQWLWPRRNKPAPVPVPTPRPQTETPAPAPPPVVDNNVPPPKPAPAPDAEPPKPPAVVIKPQPEPVLIAPQPRHPRVRHKPPPVVEATPAPRPRVRKPAPQTTGGFCFFPISCATVCSYARAGDNRRGTPCQNAMGLACIRSTCPEVLRRR